MLRIKPSLALPLLVFVLAAILQPAARADITMPHSVVGSGGGEPSNATYSISGTLGQAVVGVISNPSNINEIGFWYQPYYIWARLEELGDLVAIRYSLGSSRPNPFGSMTRVDYSIPKCSPVMIKLYDVNGREVRTLVEGEVEPGYHSVTLDGTDLSCGVYFCRMASGHFVEMRKLVLLK
jgi:hypothetical protein